MTRGSLFVVFVAAVLVAVALVSPGTVSVNAQGPAPSGEWTKLPDLPFFPVHNHLLPDGTVMLWPGDAGISGDNPHRWDPATQTATPLAKPGYDVFCTGHAFLADGRLFVAGGHIVNGVGLPKASIYNPFSNTWTPAPDMNAGRWYPTVTTLANGDALVVSGDIDNTIGVNTLPQVYQVATNTWRNLTGAQLYMELYSMIFLAPNGKAFVAAPTTLTRYLDTSGTGAWSTVGYRTGAFRDYGSAVMYADGKILVLGGGDPPQATAEVIDLNAASPAWRAVQSMKIARRQVNATLLPDGTVLVTGGTSGPGFNNETTPVFSTELWNPDTETWTTLASATVPRLYHSAAILLPDGRVLTTGGNDYVTPEVFSPPYLSKGARPSLSGTPAGLGYGQTFQVQTDATAISKVTLIRITSVTHAFNENQRLTTLPFTLTSGQVSITAPANANLAPPGHYLLFLVNGQGVPSVGGMVQLGGSAPPPPPTLTTLSPSSATSGGAAFTLTVNGTGFVSGATVRWNGAARTTTFVNGSQVRASISASDIATVGTASVTAVNPGSTASNALTFTVTPPAVPTLSSLSPSGATAGGAAFTLTVNGTGFVSGATVQWNGASRTTTFVSASQVTAAIPASDIAAVGTPQVTAVNPGSATSNALAFTVANAAPAESSLSPNNATVGGAGFTLTVNGTGFVSGATVRWNGANRTTTFVSASQVTAAIPASDIATAGTPQVTAVNPGSATSNALAFTVANAAPAESALSPNSATAGGAGFTLTVNGTGFVSGATVRWNGANRTTTFVSASQVTAAIPASDIATAGTAQVTAMNPGSAASNAMTFTVAPAAPAESSLSPNNAPAGGAGFTLTVNGTGFVSGATVQWNGAARTTTFVSGSQVTAAIPASDIAASGTAQVTAVNPGSTASNALTFTVNAPPAAPTLSSELPNSATAGGPAFTLTVNGSGFVSGATVQWNGSSRSTTFVSASQVTAAVTASDIAAAGTAQVTAVNPGSTASNGLTFTVNAPPAAPTLSSELPNSATAGGPAFNLTVNGTGFVSGATVQWNGSPRATTFSSGSQLAAAILASDIATAGTAQVSVMNPDGGLSNAMPFNVSSGAASFTLTVTKTGPNASKGTVTSSPNGINCGSTCSWSFPKGTVVTLGTRVIGNTVFGMWGDACSGTGTCTVTITGDTTVTATFNRR